MSASYLTEATKKELLHQFGAQVRFDVSLASMSRWRIGGTADVVISPRNIEELAAIRTWLYSQGLPSVIIGATSNILFADSGLRAVAIKIGSDFSPISFQGNEVVAGPGVWVPLLARKAMQAGLTGLEHICGIPGTLGGLVCMNGGSQRKGIGDSIKSVKSVDIRGNIIERTHDECEFAYRKSIFQGSSEAVCQVTLQLSESASLPLCRQAMLAILRDRRIKFPTERRNCGSVFVSNPAMYEQHGPPGKVIEDAGYKGYRIGDAVVSSQHANFILNTGSATARDVLAIISKVREGVLFRTGYSMQVEIHYISPSGKASTI